MYSSSFTTVLGPCLTFLIHATPVLFLKFLLDQNVCVYEAISQYEESLVLFTIRKHFLLAFLLKTDKRTHANA